MPPIPEGRMLPLAMPDIFPLEKPPTHDLCQNELYAMFKDQLTQKVLQKQTARRMKLYYENPNDFCSYSNYFEYIDEVSDGKAKFKCYSMRFNKLRELGNLRILFVVRNGVPFLLHAFQEQKGAKSYKKGIDVVKVRLKEEC